MKLIVCLLGLAGAIAFTGCASDENYEHRGGVYDDTYHNYGHDYNPGYWDRDGNQQWNQHYWRY
jgi:hypothetical protein